MIIESVENAPDIGRKPISRNDMAKLADFAPCLRAVGPNSYCACETNFSGRTAIRVCEDDWVPSLHATVVGVRRVKVGS